MVLICIILCCILNFEFDIIIMTTYLKTLYTWYTIVKLVFSDVNPSSEVLSAITIIFLQLLVKFKSMWCTFCLAQFVSSADNNEYVNKYS